MLQSSAVPHIIEADKIGERIMQVNIYKDGRLVKKITDVRFTILHKDKSLEIETEDETSHFLALEDYSWFNVI